MSRQICVARACVFGARRARYDDVRMPRHRHHRDAARHDGMGAWAHIARRVLTQTPLPRGWPILSRNAHIHMHAVCNALIHRKKIFQRASRTSFQTLSRRDNDGSAATCSASCARTPGARRTSPRGSRDVGAGRLQKVPGPQSAMRRDECRFDF